MTDPAIIEAADKSLQTILEMVSLGLTDTRRLAKVLLGDVTPLIRAAALEEAAKILEGDKRWTRWRPAPGPRIQDDIAAALRALKEQP